MMKVRYRCNPRHTWSWDEPYHGVQKDVPAKHRLTWADGDPTLLYSERRDGHPWSPPVHVVNEFYTVPASATVSDVAKIVGRFLGAIATAPSCRAPCSAPAASDSEHVSVRAAAGSAAPTIATPASCDRCDVADDPA